MHNKIQVLRQGKEITINRSVIFEVLTSINLGSAILVKELQHSFTEEKTVNRQHIDVKKFKATPPFQDDSNYVTFVMWFKEFNIYIHGYMIIPESTSPLVISFSETTETRYLKELEVGYLMNSDVKWVAEAI
jgi:hypothetical protein